MAKRKHSLNLSGTMDLDFNIGTGTVTEVIKDAEYEYDLFALLNEFNGKNVKISVTQEDDVQTIGDSE